MKTKVKALYSRKTCKDRTPSPVNCWGPLPHCDKLFYTPCGVAYCALADIWIKKMVKHAMWWSKNQSNTLTYIYSVTRYLLKWMWRLQNLASYTTIKNKKWRMRAEDRTPRSDLSGRQSSHVGNGCVSHKQWQQVFHRALQFQVADTHRPNTWQDARRAKFSVNGKAMNIESWHEEGKNANPNADVKQTT